MYERLETFYLEYHKILKEAVEYLDPSIIISVHSHDPDMDSTTSLPDILLYNPIVNTRVLSCVYENLNNAKFKVEATSKVIF